MSIQEKILLFRALLAILATGKFLILKLVVDPDVKKQTLERINSICRELSDYINLLYDRDRNAN